MLVTFSLIVAIFPLCVFLGLLTTVSNRPGENRIDQELSIMMILGLLIWSNVLLLVALFIPLHSFLAPLTLVALCLLHGKNRSVTAFRKTRVLINAHATVIPAAALIGCVLALSPVTWGDTHLYHYPLVNWMRTFGINEGMGLVLGAFGYSQTWFTLTAVLDDGLLQGQLGSLAGSLAISVLATGCFLSFQSMAKRGLRLPDVFLVTSLALTLVIWTVDDPAILNSQSPDLPAQIIVLYCIYLFLSSHAASDSHWRLIGYLIVLGFSVRLTVAPLFVLIAYRYLQERRIFLPVTWLIPSILSTHLASGCVYFPLAFLCSSVPNWSPRGRAMEFTNHIRENARWHWERTPAGADALDWLSYHLQHVHASFPAFLLVATFIMLVGTAIRMGLIQSNRIKAVFGMTVFALLFATTVAPALRYHTGWIVTVPALGFGIFVLRYKAGFSPLVRYYIPVVTITLLGILGWRHPFVMAQHYRLLKDGQLSQAAFLEAASAFDQQDYIKAYRVYDWACRINTGHPEACSDRKIVLDRLSPEQKVELRNLETNRIGIRIDFPTIEPWYWLFPGPAQSFDSLLHFRTLDWHGTQILVTEDASLVRCSSQPAPCFSDDAYKTVAPMNPERGVRGGVTVSDRPWVH